MRIDLLLDLLIHVPVDFLYAPRQNYRLLRRQAIRLVLTHILERLIH